MWTGKRPWCDAASRCHQGMEALPLGSEAWPQLWRKAGAAQLGRTMPRGNVRLSLEWLLTLRCCGNGSAQGRHRAWLPDTPTTAATWLIAELHQAGGAVGAGLAPTKTSGSCRRVLIQHVRRLRLITVLPTVGVASCHVQVRDRTRIEHKQLGVKVCVKTSEAMAAQLKARVSRLTTNTTCDIGGSRARDHGCVRYVCASHCTVTEGRGRFSCLGIAC